MSEINISVVYLQLVDSPHLQLLLLSLNRCIHIRVLRICIVIVARIYIYNILRIITCGDVHVIYNLPKATQFISVNRKHRAAQLRVHGAVLMVSVDFVA